MCESSEFCLSLRRRRVKLNVKSYDTKFNKPNLDINFYVIDIYIFIIAIDRPHQNHIRSNFSELNYRNEIKTCL